MAVVLVIGDLHAPYMHAGAVSFLTKLAKQTRPDVIVQIGDEVEAHRWSTHPQSPNLPGPADELDLARKQLAPLFKLFPTALVCHSNHTLRWAKRAAEAGLPRTAVKTAKEILDAPPGWTWDDWHTVDGVQYRHGDGFGGRFAAVKAMERLRRPVVMGHLHEQAGVWYQTVQGDEPLFACATGCLIDSESEAFGYARYSAGRPMLGAAVVYGGMTAHFVPMPT